MARGHHDRRLGQLLLRPRPRHTATSGRRRTSRPAREADEYEVTFAVDRAMFRRVDAEIETRTEIVVSPEDDAELRRVSITNHSQRTRNIELTSYAEVVLAPGDADLAHPAFSNLFVETTRRARARRADLRAPAALRDRAVVPGSRAEPAGTRRRGRRSTRPIARGSSAAAARSRDPMRCSSSDRLSNTTGAVLDPIVSLRQTMRLPPGGTGAPRVHDRVRGRRGRRDAADREVLTTVAPSRGRWRWRARTARSRLRHFGLTVDDTHPLPASRQAA